MIALLLVLSLAGTLTTVLFWLARKRIAVLPKQLESGGGIPIAVLIQPVIHSDAETLQRLHCWMRSAEDYPGKARVIVSTLETLAPDILSVAREHPDLDVCVVSVSDEARSKEKGLDKANRLAVAEAELDKIECSPCVLVAVDEDIAPVDPHALERLVAAAPSPGGSASVTIPSAQLSAGSPFWKRLQALQLRSFNQILSIGHLLFGNAQGILQGYCSVIWRQDLDRLGGWASVSDFLGEDIALGVRAAREQIQTLLLDPSGVLVTETEGHSLVSYISQQQRWARMRRACVPSVQLAMTLGLPLKLPIFTGILAFVISPSLVTASVATIAWATTTFSLAQRPVEILLVPLEELLTVLAHLWGFLTPRVTYGRWTYRVRTDGRIVSKEWRSRP